jgi:hypothetical protein
MNNASEPIALSNVNTADWPVFSDIPEPRMVALYTGNGSGTKLFQGFLDGHPELYMVPAYPLMYLYPHWYQWQDELRDNWNWEALVDIFCIKHASVIDTRRIPGFDGLARLGESQDEYIAIDEELFRTHLLHLLKDEPIKPRTFLLAIHYAYSYARGQDMSVQKVLVYHVHVHEYLRDFLFVDFPDMLVLATVRDPRSNFSGRYNSSEVDVDMHRYNATDAIIFKRRVYYFVTKYFYETLQVLDGFPLDRVRTIRHEALYYQPESVMRETAKFLGIDFLPCMMNITFGEKNWWGDPIYKMPPMNKVNPKIVSLDWQKKIDAIDWFVFEGMFFDYMEKYGYQPFKVKSLSFANKVLLFLCFLLPSKPERSVLSGYLRASEIRNFFRSTVNEATGQTPMKDYSFNAYYRHKWTQKDLQIWRPRGYVERLKSALQNDNASPGQPNFVVKLRIAQAWYIFVNAARYGWAIIGYPYWILRRWKISLKAFSRVIQRHNILPDPLE